MRGYVYQFYSQIKDFKERQKMIFMTQSTLCENIIHMKKSHSYRGLLPLLALGHVFNLWPQKCESYQSAMQISPEFIIDINEGIFKIGLIQVTTDR